MKQNKIIIASILVGIVLVAFTSINIGCTSKKENHIGWDNQKDVKEYLEKIQIISQKHAIFFSKNKTQFDNAANRGDIEQVKLNMLKISNLYEELLSLLLNSSPPDELKKYHNLKMKGFKKTIEAYRSLYNEETERYRLLEQEAGSYELSAYKEYENILKKNGVYKKYLKTLQKHNYNKY